MLIKFSFEKFFWITAWEQIQQKRKKNSEVCLRCLKKCDMNQLPGINIMKLCNTKWNKTFFLKAVLVVQPLLFWLGASPDGLIYDKEYSDHPGLLKIKYPYNRRNSSLADFLSDQSFYLQQNKNGEILLKKDNHFGSLYPSSDGYGTIAS